MDWLNLVVRLRVHTLTSCSLSGGYCAREVNRGPVTDEHVPWGPQYLHLLEKEERRTHYLPTWMWSHLKLEESQWHCPDPHHVPEADIVGRRGAPPSMCLIPRASGSRRCGGTRISFPTYKSIDYHHKFARGVTICDK